MTAELTLSISMQHSEIETPETVNFESTGIFEDIMGCRVIRKPLTVAEMRELVKDAPDAAVFDKDLALLMQAFMVFGTPENLDNLRKCLVQPEGFSSWNSEFIMTFICLFIIFVLFFYGGAKEELSRLNFIFKLINQ